MLIRQAVIIAEDTMMLIMMMMIVVVVVVVVAPGAFRYGKNAAGTVPILCADTQA